MVKAKIVGETHVSQKDIKRLEEIIESENYEAIFVEGRENKILESSSPSISYIFFLFGWLEWLLLQKLYAGKERIYKLAKERNIIIFDSIDATLPQIFRMSNNS